MAQPAIIRWQSSDGDPTEAALRRKLENMGYTVIPYTYAPGTVFPDHTHAVDKIDAVLRGRFRIVVSDTAFVLGAGDAIEIPHGIVHRAEVLGDTPVESLDGVRR